MLPFTINDAFTVTPETNTILADTKLEPRLMKLLLLLVQNAGRLVSREEIIEKLWDNYGGADDGLTQAISFLRKVLNDADKKLIETVPKGGYIFTGKIDEPVERTVAQKNVASAKTISLKAAGIAAAVLMIVFALVIYWMSSTKNYAPRPAQSNEAAPSTEAAPKP